VDQLGIAFELNVFFILVNVVHPVEADRGVVILAELVPNSAEWE